MDAIFLTVDAPVGGKREKDMRLKIEMDPVRPPFPSFSMQYLALSKVRLLILIYSPRMTCLRNEEEELRSSSSGSYTLPLSSSFAFPRQSKLTNRDPLVWSVCIVPLTQTFVGTTSPGSERSLLTCRS
jgi:hypothetical protein